MYHFKLILSWILYLHSGTRLGACVFGAPDGKSAHPLPTPKAVNSNIVKQKRFSAHHAWACVVSEAFYHSFALVVGQQLHIRSRFISLQVEAPRRAVEYNIPPLQASWKVASTKCLTALLCMWLPLRGEGSSLPVLADVELASPSSEQPEVAQMFFSVLPLLSLEP